MNTYEQKQEAKRARLNAKADRADNDANTRFKRVDTMAGVMNGQPILVGHHSEKRHRRDVDRMDRDLHKGVEGKREAKDLRRRAVAVGSAGVSSDDPDAVEKLQVKLEALEAKREAFKKHNREVKARRRDKSRRRDDTNEEVLPSYVLTNLGARIRSTKQRIAALKARSQEEERPPVTAGDWTVREDREDNRILLEHDGKPAAEVRTALKRAGFRWSPSRTAWVRQLNNAGRYAAERVLREIGGVP